MKLQLEEIVLRVAMAVEYTIDSEHTDGNETPRLHYPRRLQHPQ